MWGCSYRSLATGIYVACLGILAPAALGQSVPRTEKPDLPASTDPVQGDWIRPSDVLYVGDSESLGYFGDNLYRALAAERDPHSGHPLKVWTYWTCGSDANSWVTGATSFCGIRSCNGAGDCARDHGPNDGPAHVRYAPLRFYLAAVHPRVTIVSLGTNILTTRDFERPGAYAAYLQDVAVLIDQIAAAGSKCIWIGPPQASLSTRPAIDYEKFVADMGRVAQSKGCHFIDSNPLSDRLYVLKKDPEGTHYQSDGEKAWEAKVWPRLEPVLRADLTR